MCYDKSKTRKIHYISGGNGLAALYIIDEAATTKNGLYFAHTDYQGSLIALSRKKDGAINIEKRFAYDPWGNRRDANNWGKALANDGSYRYTSRGYTLHEHLDGFGIINMNGRVYDPMVSRFLSPDPFVQLPGMAMGYNRYAYCLNNPLLYTDPSGNILEILGIAFGSWLLNSTAEAINNDRNWFEAAGDTPFVISSNQRIPKNINCDINISNYDFSDAMPMRNFNFTSDFPLPTLAFEPRLTLHEKQNELRDYTNRTVNYLPHVGITLKPGRVGGGNAGNNLSKNIDTSNKGGDNNLWVAATGYFFSGVDVYGNFVHNNLKYPRISKAFNCGSNMGAGFMMIQSLYNYTHGDRSFLNKADGIVGFANLTNAALIRWSSIGCKALGPIGSCYSAARLMIDISGGERRRIQNNIRNNCNPLENVYNPSLGF
ncbi:RHS repeat-associated core domain-containing protein [Marinilabiliaceae bacterium JC017]|nr:RHS repeat-associated core domain-containing protein [Marinilabiliaceae bacterium JC017]